MAPQDNPVELLGSWLESELTRRTVPERNRHFFSPTPVKRTELDILIILPTVSVAIFTVYALRHVIQRALPAWLKPFAQDDGSSDEDGGLPPRKRRKRTVWTFLLGIICLAGMILSFLPSIFVHPKQGAVMLEIVPWVAATLIWSFDQPTKTPRTLMLLLLLVLGAYLWRCSVHFLNHTLLSLDPFRLSQAILSFLGIIIIGNMPTRPPEWPSSKIGSPNHPPTINLRSPEDNLTLFQFWTMKWVNPLGKVGLERDIVVDDVWQLPYEYQHSRLYLAFRELKGKLLRKLGRANGLDLTMATLCTITERVAEVSNIRLTARLYQALDQEDFQEATFWCLAMLFVDGCRQVAKTTGMWFARKAYERSRGETFIALFGKLLTRCVPGSDKTEKGPSEENPSGSNGKANPFVRLFRKFSGSQQEYLQVQEEVQEQVQEPAQEQVPIQGQDTDQPASNAKIVNLVRNDTYEISQRFWDLSKTISCPIKIGFTMYYLVDIMGWPSMVGVGTMVFFFGLNSFLVKIILGMERKRTKHSDKRAQAVAHYVEASRALKLNAWTDTWEKRIMRFREPEMRQRLSMSYLNAGINMINLAGGMFYPVASIGLYTVFMGQSLPNEVIWPSLQLFSQLEASVKEAFDLISALWKSTIPIGRVHEYMAEPDRDEQHGDPGARDIAFENASFAWPATDRPVLRGLNLTFPSGLTIIKGKVAAGKSSLLLAALNEMELQEGNLVRPDEPIAYGQQHPWLQSKTIRENIVFHERYDAQRYRNTLHACALGPDLAILPDEDQTKLEEGGIGLSGGQKARVALARAVYSSSRILLLDDPLAALDHDTASLITSRFLKGPLAKDRTIVMVTHREELVLRIADQVIEVEEGSARILSPNEIREELEHPHNKSTDAVREDDSKTAVRDGNDADLNLREEPEEAGQSGTVRFSVYTRYMAAGGWHLWVTLAFFYVASRACDILRARLLEAWGRDTGADISFIRPSDRFLHLPDPDIHPKIWIGVLGLFSVGQVASYSIAQYLLARICYNAATVLFEIAVRRVGKATFRYFDTTQTGQLKNRLVNDMGMVDGGILAPLEGFIYQAITLVAALVAITLQQPMLLIFIGNMALLLLYLFRIYLPVSRCLRRLEMRYLTPIIANIGVMQNGLVTIRALRVEGHFQDRHLSAVDDFQKQDHFYWGMSFWLDFRTSMSSALMRAGLVLFMMWYGTPASAIGFVLTQATVAVTSVQSLCERFATLQLDAVALERVDMLNEIPEEPNGHEKPPADWPREDDIVKFENMSFQYDKHLPKVLNDVTFEIPGGSTCAVLGRTGSGKSTIANALLVTEPPCSGKVKIGDYDLSLVDRNVLRSRLTFVQQDPTLFPGTLRENIDPELRYGDEECEKVIHRVLGPGWTLDSSIDAGGLNLSQGQRQLVSIGRAIIRRSGLVILDEATASIDRKTAAKMQKLLREELRGSTVITIAHRLEAVEDASWCLRLDSGRVTQCGPAKGLEDKGKGRARDESEGEGEGEVEGEGEDEDEE